MQFIPSLNRLDRRPYRIGLALSGGGARGFAHAGALQALEDMHVKPDMLAGVSAGAVVCALYAAGNTPTEIVQMFLTAKFTDFAELSVPKDGFFRLDGFKKFLSDHIKYKNLEDLPIPTVLGVTNLDTCQPAVFEKGEITERVLASCSIPLVFKPRLIEGAHYVDGGVLHNLPSWIIRDRCRYLIGINCSPVPHKRYSKPSLIDVANRTYNMMAKHNATADMALCDLPIEINDIAGYKVFNLREIKKVYTIGYQTTIDTLVAHGFKKPDEVKRSSFAILRRLSSLIHI